MNPSLETNQLHERMLRNVFLNIELLLNDGIREISEYDVQSLMFLYFRRALHNSELAVGRETHGKVDCVLYKSEVPKVFYELKTYFKNHEQLSQTDFDHDITKLSERIADNAESKGYMIIAGRKAAFDVESLADFEWLRSRVHDYSKNWVEFLCLNGRELKLRPSQMQHYGLSIAFSWEVKL